MTWIPAAEFFVDGDPKPWRPPRVTKFGTFSPHASDAWQLDVLEAARNNAIDNPLEGPVSMDIIIYVPRPQRLKSGPAGPILCTKRPDRINYAKLLEDLLQPKAIWNFKGFYLDDSQVCAGPVEKWYHAKDKGPGAMIRISRWEDEGEGDG